MRSTFLLPSLPGQLWPAVLAPDRVQTMGQIELFDIKTLFEIVLFDHLTVCKQMTDAKLNF